MSPDQQRVAIAEACPNVFRVLNGECHWRYGCEGYESRVDPLDDLNAMHEAEKVLTQEQIAAYVGYLAGETPYPHVVYERLLFATAAQKGEAFLKATGKWKESPRWQDDAEDGGESRRH